jgi:membrane peptidoglycan carboxypeptidase
VALDRPRILIAIPILLFAVLLVVGLAGLVTVAAAYNFYSQGLPDPKEALGNLSFDQQTIVTDRTGGTELARLGEFKREVVTFDEVPPELLDATTAIEDKDFWTNPGFDFFGFVSATLDTLSGHPRGGSTITQQLVRARLLPAQAFAGSREERKIREIIQSLRLTQAYPGANGKQEIITAYLNQNFYGNQSYGVKAAARTYFNKNLKDLTLAQVAVLARIPSRRPRTTSSGTPRSLRDPEQEHGATATREEARPRRVRTQPEIYKRRNYVLDLMKSRRARSPERTTPGRVRGAKAQPIVLAPQLGNADGPGSSSSRSARSSARSVLPGCLAGPMREDRHRRLPGHDHARHEDAGDRPEVALRRGVRAQPQRHGRPSSRR